MVDKDPTWRSGAVFKKAELRQLISDDRIPQARRVLYALMGIGGLRSGEAAGLRWGRWLTDRDPLSALDIVTSYDTGRTKTGKPRTLPVHPTLSALLSEWRLSGWAEAFGRPPKDDDLVVPLLRRKRTPAGRMRDKNVIWKDFNRDQQTLGFRHRRAHDLRRTMISLSRDDGARADLLVACTHSRKGNIVDLYTEFSWGALCAEVSKLRITREQPRIVELKVAAAAGARLGAGQPESGGFNTVLNTVEDDPERSQQLEGWRRRESNPGPERVKRRLLHA